MYSNIIKKKNNESQKEFYVQVVHILVQPQNNFLGVTHFILLRITSSFKYNL